MLSAGAGPGWCEQGDAAVPRVAVWVYASRGPDASAANAGRLSRPLLLTQLELLDLARGRLRQLLDQLDRLRRLEPRDPALDVLDQLLRGGGLPVGEHHERLRALAPLLVRHADDGRLQHRGVGHDG